MPQLNFLIALEGRLDCSLTPQVVMALKQDTLVWNSLAEDENFSHIALSIMGDKVENWSPAQLSILDINHDFTRYEIGQIINPNLSLEPELIRLAVKTYEDFQHNAIIPATLKEVGLLALALRERFKLTHSWNELLNELLDFINNSSEKMMFLTWRTTLACLFGLLAEPIDMLKSLLNTSKKKLPILWITHAILSNPINMNEQAELLKNLLIEVPLTQQVSWLKIINLQGRSDLVAFLASRLLCLLPDNKTEGHNNQSEYQDVNAALEKVLESQNAAILAQMAKQNSQAETLIRDAKKALQFVQAGMDIQSQCLRSQEKDYENDSYEDEQSLKQDYSIPKSLIEEKALMSNKKITESDQKVEALENYTNPFLALKNAIVLYENNKVEAKEYARKAVFRLAEQQARGINCFVPSFSYEWIPAKIVCGLIDMDLFLEALQIALVLLQERPVDMELINLVSIIFLKLGQDEKSFEYAQLNLLINQNNPECHRQIAGLFEKQENWEKAFTERQKVLQFNKEPDIQDWIALAQDAYKVKQSSLALEACEIVLNIDKNNQKAHALMGKLYFALGDKQLAKNHTLEAINLDKRDIQSYLLLSEIYDSSKESDKVLETLNNASIEVPDSYDVNYQLAKKLCEKGNYSEAETYAHKAFELSPDSIEAAVQLGTSLINSGKIEEVKRFCEEIRQDWSQNSDLAYLHAQTYLFNAENDVAIPILEIAINTKEPQPDRLNLYADTLLGGEKSFLSSNRVSDEYCEKAQCALEKVFSISPNDFKTQLLMAELLRMRGDYHSALDIYQKLIENSQAKIPEIWWRIQAGFGQTALCLNMVDAALVALQECVQIKPDNIDINKLLADTYERTNLKDNAIQIAKYVLLLSQEDLENSLWFVELMIRLDNKYDAVATLEHVMQLDPWNYDHPLRLVEILIENNQLEKATTLLAEVSKREQISPDVLQRISLIYRRLNNPVLAYKSLEQAFYNSQSSDLDILLEAITNLYREGDLTRVIELLDSALYSCPDNVNLHLLKADILAEMGENDKTISILERLVSLQENEPLDNRSYHWDDNGEMWGYAKGTFCLSEEPGGIYYRLAYLLRRQSNYSMAQHYAQIAYQHNQDHEGILYLLCDLRLAQIDPQVTDLEKIIDPWIKKYIHCVYENREQKYSDIFGLILSIRAEIALINNDVDMIDVILKSELVKNSNQVRQQAILIRLLVSKGDWKQAEEMYEQMISCFKEIGIKGKIDDKSIWGKYKLCDENDQYSDFWLGEAALDLHRWDEALNYFQLYQERNKLEPRAHLGMARALVICAEIQRLYEELEIKRHLPGFEKLDDFHNKEFAQAINELKRINDSPLIHKWNLRGEAVFYPSAENIEKTKLFINEIKFACAYIAGMRQIGEKVESFELSEKLLQNPDLLQQLSLYEKEINIEKALRYAKQAVGYRPGDVVGHYILGRVAEKSGDREFALRELEQALVVWPDEPEWHHRAAQLAEKSSVSDRMIIHWEKAFTLEPSSVDYALSLSNAYIKSGDPKQAIRVLEQIIAIDPKNEIILRDLSRAYLADGKLSEAFNYAERASKIDGASYQSNLLCGQIALNLNKPNIALEYGRKVFKMSQSDHDVTLLISRALVKMGNLSRGLTVLDQALPNASLPILLERGILIGKIHGCNAALPLFSELDKQFPDDIDVKYQLAYTQMECKLLHDAEETSSMGLKIQPDHPGLNLLAGKLHRNIGQLDKAINFFSEAVRNDPMNIEPYLELGETYEERREYIKSLETYQRAIKHFPEDPRPYTHAGLALRESKDYQTSEMMFRHAAELAPDDLNIRRQLSTIIALNLVHNSQEVLI